MVYGVVTFGRKNIRKCLPTGCYVGAGTAAEAALYGDIARTAAEREFAFAGRWQRANDYICGGVIDRQCRAGASGAACLNLKCSLRRRVNSSADGHRVGGRAAAVRREDAAGAIGRALKTPIPGDNDHSDVC